jgi:DNA polymerase-4
VVSTASYEARAFGIRSAMPLRTAYKRNPEAIFLPVDSRAYLAASREVMDTLRTFDAEVEVAGWDEAFLAVTTEDPESFAKRIQERVLERTRLWCTIGIGDNRLQAKLASGFGKPRGVFVLTSDRWDESMHGLATTELWGIGSKTAAKLASWGSGPWASSRPRTRARSPSASARRRGRGSRASDAARARRACTRGDGPPRVGAGSTRSSATSRIRTRSGPRSPGPRARSRAISAGTTGSPHVSVVKVRFAPFFTSTHGVTLAEPTADADLVAEAAARALERFDLTGPSGSSGSERR